MGIASRRRHPRVFFSRDKKHHAGGVEQWARLQWLESSNETARNQVFRRGGHSGHRTPSDWNSVSDYRLNLLRMNNWTDFRSLRAKLDPMSPDLRKSFLIAFQDALTLSGVSSRSA